jgi:hypothetical protein
MLRVSQRACLWIACLAATLLGACRSEPAGPDPDAIASRYIQLAWELSRHDPSLVDHWIVEPPAPGGAGRRPVAMLRAAADALAAETAAALPEVDGLERLRLEWLLGQARALQLASRRLLGESVPFDVEARLAFGASPQRADRFQVDRAHEMLERELPGEGPLADRLAAFRARFQVVAEARETVLRAALAACGDAAAPALALPSDNAIELAFVDGLPWDAHARYLGGHRTRIEVDGNQPLDLTRALRVACHEGHVGHHAQHIWAADELVGRRGWREYGLVPGFGRALLLAEGAAEIGAELAMPAARRVRVYRETLAPAAGLSKLEADDFLRLIRIEDAQAAIEPLIADIAREYLDNHITAAATAERLEQEVLMPAPEAFVFFIERRRTRILAYTEGRRLARERIGAAGLAGLRALFVPEPR